ncbi:MAG: hypothetical protein KA004_03555 [Verrucomicrobiales bacterium]|nr:hypothetical protein [Verrucomicrobiales bacterium]
MKLTLLAILPLFLAVLPVRSADYRTFSNPDKTKSFAAIVTGFTQKDGKPAVLLTTAERRTLTVPLASLSAEDQEFLKKEAELFAIAKNLQIEIKESNAKPVEQTTTNRKISTTERGYAVKIHNNSGADISGLNVRYRIIYKKAKWDEKNREELSRQMAEGVMSVDSLASRQAFQQMTSTIPVVSNRPYKPPGCAT